MATKKKTTSKSTKTAPMRSFQRTPNPQPFFTFKLTQQTVYWLLIGVLVVGIGVWMTLVSLQLQRVYDEVQIQNELHSAQPSRKE